MKKIILITIAILLTVFVAQKYMEPSSSQHITGLIKNGIQVQNTNTPTDTTPTDQKKIDAELNAMEKDLEKTNSDDFNSTGLNSTNLGL